MDNSRKYLKIWSFVVLLFAGLTLLEIVSALWLGDLSNIDLSTGNEALVLLVTRIVVLSVSLICLIPQVYIGVKGLKVAKNPDSSKGHIIWGTVLLVFAVIGVISPLTEIIKQNAVGENVRNLFGVIVEVTVFYDYLKYARAVARGK